PGVDSARRHGSIAMRIALDEGSQAVAVSERPAPVLASVRSSDRSVGESSGQLGLRAGSALAVAALGFFVVTLDALVVNVALPAIGRDLGGGITGSQWVVDGYTLMFAALLLSAGAL